MTLIFFVADVRQIPARIEWSAFDLSRITADDERIAGVIE
jgi:hypothetical protein